MTLASSGAGRACDGQFRLKEGTRVIVVEGSAGVGRRWAAEKIWVMEATESSHGVSGWGGSLQVAIARAGVQASFPFRYNSRCVA